jgi:steroid delta-isomerase-like uncharacterized protein
MSVEENIKNVRRLNDEVFNKGNLALVDELMTPEYVFHITPEVKGPEGVKKYIADMRAAFPDLHITIEGMVAEGDMVAIQYTMRGTFKGKWMDIAPTGKKFVLPNAGFARFKDGKQVEVWPYLDSLTLYQQLGIPIPAGQA